MRMPGVPQTNDLRHDVRLAVRDTIGVGLGLFPIGLAFGVLVVQSGFHWWWAPLFSTIVYAGSIEFLMVGLIWGLSPSSKNEGGDASGAAGGAANAAADAGAPARR